MRSSLYAFEVNAKQMYLYSDNTDTPSHVYRLTLTGQGSNQDFDDRWGREVTKNLGYPYS